jgi:hypothetical protein
MEATPIFEFISGGLSIDLLKTKPYLAFGVTQFYAYSWIFYSPYFVYRFYAIETREFNKPISDILWTKPISDKSIYLQRFFAIILEYYIIIIISCLSFIIPDIIFRETTDTLNAIILIHLTLPAYLGLGVFTSILIVYFPKKKMISVLFTSIIMILHFIGLLNRNFELLSQMTPFFYFNPATILFNGYKINNIIVLLIFSIIILIGVIIRLNKKEKYVILD